MATTLSRLASSRVLNRPGGNVTGVAFFNSALVGKRLELLHELLPAATVIAFLVNPHSLQAEQETKDAQKAARALGQELHMLSTKSAHDIDDSFAKAHDLHAQAILMAADPFLGSRRDQVAALAASYAMPVMGTTREYAASGCLSATPRASGMLIAKLASTSPAFSREKNRPICR